MENSGRRLKIVGITEGAAAHIAGLQINDILESYDDTILTCDLAISHATSKANVSDTPDNKSIVKFYRESTFHETKIQNGKLGILTKEVDIDPTEYFNELNISSLISEMVVTTTHSLDNHIITKCYGIVTAECVLGMNFFSDLLMSVTDIVGGRSGTTQNALKSAKNTCLQELKREAAIIGANAIVGSSIHYNQFSGKDKSMIFVVASGTAVTLAQI